MDSAEGRRSEANSKFRDGDVKGAAVAYTAAIDALAALESASDASTANLARMERAILLCNRAACSLKLNDADSAVRDATEAISLKPGMAKAYYRRALAFRAKKLGMRAVADLQAVLRLEPDNTAVIALVQELVHEARLEAAKPHTAVAAANAIVAALSGAVGGTAASASSVPAPPVEIPTATSRSPTLARSTPPGVTTDPGLSLLIGKMAHGLRGPSAGVAAMALAGNDAPVRIAEALESSGSLAPIVLLSALRQVMQAAESEGVQAVARAVAAHPGAFWPASADASATSPFADRSVPDEPARLMALAEVASAAQEARQRALALCEAIDSPRVPPPLRGAAGIAAVVDALSEAPPVAVERAVVALSLRASAHALSRSAGASVEDFHGGSSAAAGAGAEAGPAGGTPVLRLGAVEAAVNCVGRAVRSRTAAELCAALGLPRRLAAAAADGGGARRRMAAEGALARVLERAARPPDALPEALERAAGTRGGPSPAAAAGAASAAGGLGVRRGAGGAGAVPLLAAAKEWLRRRRAHGGADRLGGVLRAVVAGVVDAEAEAAREAMEAEAAADDKAGQRAAMRGLAAKRRQQERPTAAAPAAEQQAAEVAALAEQQAAEEASRRARAAARQRAEASAAEFSRSRPVADRHRAAVALAALFLVDRDAALGACRWRGLLPGVFSLASSPSVPAQAACAEVLSHLAADADGRELVGQEGWTALRRLSEVGTTTIRASALVTLSRTMASAKATAGAALAEMGGEAGPGGLRAEVAREMGLVRPGAGAEDASAAAPAPGAGPASSSTTGSAATAEERGLVESYVAVARSLQLAVGPGAAAWASGAGGRAAGAGMGAAVDPTAAAQTVTLAADPEGLFAITVRAPPEDDVPDVYGRRAEMTEAGAGAAIRAAPLVIAAGARSVEALAVLCTRTVVKRALSGDKDTLTSLLAMAGALAAEADAAYKGTGTGIVSSDWGSAALGVCFCVYALTVSEQERRERSLAERDVTPQQWQQFQKMTMGGGGEDPEADPPGDVDARMRGLLASGVLGALHRLAGASSLSWRAQRASQAGARAAGGGGLGPASGGGEGVWEVSSGSGRATLGAAWRGLSEADRMRAEQDEQRRPTAASGTLQFVSASLQNLSSRVWARPLLAGAGAVPLLLRLSGGDSGNTVSGRTMAAHGLAQVLVSTNPGLLAEAHRLDAVGPLLMLTHSPSGLQCFEAALALTNLGSHGTEERLRIVAMGGLSALEDVQFCDHYRLRRAGTEALANLAMVPAGAGHITGDRLGLWLALCRSYGDDALTAVAAAGGIAMALAMDDGDPIGEEDAAQGGRARLLAHPRGVSALCCAVASGHQPLQHRALAALQQLVGATAPPGPSASASTSAPASGKALQGWEELTRPRELGLGAEEGSQTAGAGAAAASGAGEGDGVPEAVTRSTAELVAASASAAGPATAGVEVSAVHLALLLAQGTPMRDLTIDDEEEEQEEGAVASAAEDKPSQPTTLAPEVVAAAAALLKDVQAAAAAAGVKLSL